MELTYRREGDYRVPNLTVPEESPVALGKYALLRKRYLKQHRRVLYLNLLTAGMLNEHLIEIEQTAMSRVEQLTAQMAAAQGVTEQMKAESQMQWVGLMNNIRHSAEELVLSDLIYT
ncbi:MAG: TnpV protein [Clostridiales bacterium]|nr:TnpV protein [Clostridiales bacterium]